MDKKYILIILLIAVIAVVGGYFLLNGNNIQTVSGEQTTIVLSKSAYMEVPKENPMENRKVVVQNMFDKVLFYKEYQLDFARIDTPVIKALFLNNGTQIQLTYLSGEDQTKIITTLDIT